MEELPIKTPQDLYPQFAKAGRLRNVLSSLDVDVPDNDKDFYTKLSDDKYRDRLHKLLPTLNVDVPENFDEFSAEYGLKKKSTSQTGSSASKLPLQKFKGFTKEQSEKLKTDVEQRNQPQQVDEKGKTVEELPQELPSGFMDEHNSLSNVTQRLAPGSNSQDFLLPEGTQDHVTTEDEQKELDQNLFKTQSKYFSTNISDEELKILPTDSEWKKKLKIAAQQAKTNSQYNPVERAVYGLGKDVVSNFDILTNDLKGAAKFLEDAAQAHYKATYELKHGVGTAPDVSDIAHPLSKGIPELLSKTKLGDKLVNQWDELKSTFPDVPDNTFGAIEKGLAPVPAMVAEFSTLGGEAKLFGMSTKLATAIVTGSALKTYNEQGDKPMGEKLAAAGESAAEGALTGTAMELSWLLGAKTKSIVKSALISGATGAALNAAETYKATGDVSIPGMIANAAFMMGGARKDYKAEGRELTDILGDRTQKAITNFFTAPQSAVKFAADYEVAPSYLREKAEGLINDAIKDEDIVLHTDENGKQTFRLNLQPENITPEDIHSLGMGTTLNNISDHLAITRHLQDPKVQQEWIDRINSNPDLPPETKQMMLQRIKDTVEANDPTHKAIEPISNDIEKLKKQKYDIDNSKILSEEERIARNKILDTQIKAKQGEIEALLQPKEAAKDANVPTKTEKVGGKKTNAKTNSEVSTKNADEERLLAEKKVATGEQPVATSKPNVLVDENGEFTQHAKKIADDWILNATPEEIAKRADEIKSRFKDAFEKYNGDGSYKKYLSLKRESENSNAENGNRIDAEIEKMENNIPKGEGEISPEEYYDSREWQKIKRTAELTSEESLKKTDPEDLYNMIGYSLTDPRTFDANSYSPEGIIKLREAYKELKSRGVSDKDIIQNSLSEREKRGDNAEHLMQLAQDNINKLKQFGGKEESTTKQLPELVGDKTTPTETKADLTPKVEPEISEPKPEPKTKDQLTKDKAGKARIKKTVAESKALKADKERVQQEIADIHKTILETVDPEAQKYIKEQGADEFNKNVGSYDVTRDMIETLKDNGVNIDNKGMVTIKTPKGEFKFEAGNVFNIEKAIKEQYPSTASKGGIANPRQVAPRSKSGIYDAEELIKIYEQNLAEAKRTGNKELADVFQKEIEYLKKNKPYESTTETPRDTPTIIDQAQTVESKGKLAENPEQATESIAEVDKLLGEIDNKVNEQLKPQEDAVKTGKVEEGNQQQHKGSDAQLPQEGDNRNVNTNVKQEGAEASNSDSVLKSEKEVRLSKSLREIASKAREGKIKKPGTFQMATPGSLAWDGAIEVFSKALEASADIIDAIDKGLEHLRNTEFYKSHKNKMSLEKQFRDAVSGIETKAKKEYESTKKKIRKTFVDVKSLANEDVNRDLLKLASYHVDEGADLGEFTKRIKDDLGAKFDLIKESIENLYNDGKELIKSLSIDDYIKENQKKIEVSNDLSNDLFKLKTRSKGDNIAAIQLMNWVVDEFSPTREDMEAIYHHAENPNEPITTKQEKLYKKVILPLQQANEMMYRYLKEQGLPISDYNPRVVIKPRGLYEMLKTGRKNIAEGRLLTKSASFLKKRQIKVLVDADGNRKIAIFRGKNEDVLGYTDNVGENLGRHNVSTIRTEIQKNIDNSNIKIGKSKEVIARLSDYKVQTPEMLSDIAYEKRMIEDEEVYKKEQREKLENGSIFIDKNKKKWTIKEATTKEIEANTNVRYYHTPFANTMTQYVKLRQIKRAVEYLESFKNSEGFKNIAVGEDEGDIPKDWKRTTLPQLKPYYFEPRIAEVLNKFDKETSGGQDMLKGVNKMNSFLRNAIFFNPMIHVPNITVHWAVNRGLSPFLLPSGYAKLLKTSSKALKAVWEKNDDYLKALDHGSPMMLGEDGEIGKVLLQKLENEVTANQSVQEKIAEALSITPVRLVKAVYQMSKKVTWGVNDFLTLQATYEEMANGRTFDEAVKEVGKHIPNYRIPARVLGSKGISDLMSNPNITMFGGYHYGALRSYGEMINDIAKGDGRHKLEAIDKIAMFALIGLVIYPEMDKIAKKITGNPNAYFRRAGSITFPENIYKLAKGYITPSQLLTSVMTPAIGTQLLAEGVENKNFFTGRNIYRAGDTFGGLFSDIFNYAVSKVGPGQLLGQYQSGSKTPKEILGNFLSITSPKYTPMEGKIVREHNEEVGVANYYYSEKKEKQIKSDIAQKIKDAKTDQKAGKTDDYHTKIGEAKAMLQKAIDEKSIKNAAFSKEFTSLTKITGKTYPEYAFKGLREITKAKRLVEMTDEEFKQYYHLAGNIFTKANEDDVVKIKERLKRLGMSANAQTVGSRKPRKI